MSRAQLTSTVEQNTGGAVSPYVAGKNKVINGDFGVWQRGTSFTNPAAFSYLADRWQVPYDGTGSTRIYSQQTFTPGSAPVAGYEGQYFFRYAHTVAGTGATYNQVQTKLENVQTFAGQTVTISFWARVASGTLSISNYFEQNFGGGGSSSVFTNAPTANTITTSWQRFTQTISNPSISGKTIGTSSYFSVGFGIPTNATFTLDIWGVQLEAGSVATPFTTATGTLSGELTACQRYYYSQGGTDGSDTFGIGFASSSTNLYLIFNCPVPLRVAPTAVSFGGTMIATNFGATTSGTISNVTGVNGSRIRPLLGVTLSGLTTGNSYAVTANLSTSAFIGVSAEL